jgi:hypothetical protein
MLQSHIASSPPLAVLPAASPPPACPRFSDIIAAAIASEGSTLIEVLSPNRNRAATRARQAAMWLAFKITPYSLQAIGRALGRHHSTVLYSIHAYERYLAEDGEASVRGDRLLAQFINSKNQEGALQ